jgi:hypothetical protein
MAETNETGGQMSTETQTELFSGTRIDALAMALKLAITAPDDEKTNEAIQLAEKLAVGMSAEDIEAAKVKATDLCKQGSEE